MSGNFTAFQEIQEMIKTNQIPGMNSLNLTTNQTNGTTGILGERQQVFHSGQLGRRVGTEI